MATVNFLYRSARENSSLTIRLLFRHNGKDFNIGADSKYLIYTIEELILQPKLSAKDYWAKDHQRGTKDLQLQNKQLQVNTDLSKLQNFLLKEFESYKVEDINKEWLQGVIDKYYNPNNNNEIPNTLVDFVDYYLEHNTHLKYGTKKKFTTIQSKLIKNQKAFSNTPILLSDINDNFKKKYNEVFLDYNVNTIARDLTEIKTLCRYAFLKGKDINKDVLEWKLKTEKTVIIYLTPEEIETIEKVDKTEDNKDLPEYLQNARDWLVISCYTGQRVSDFMRFDSSMIRIEKNKSGKDIHLIEFVQVKTQTRIAVPLHDKVINILKRRNGQFPRTISSQKYNDFIKEVCKIAKIYQSVYGCVMQETFKESGVFRKKKGMFKKHELITSHIGRRSFATNNFGRIPTRLLMSATGHLSEKMFLNYIGKSQTDQAKELADWF